MKNKFKSYSFWTALAAAIVVLVEALGSIFGFIPDGKLVSDIIMAIAGVLVVLGVVSAPSGTNKEDGLTDEIEEEAKLDVKDESEDKDEK